MVPSRPLSQTSAGTSAIKRPCIDLGGTHGKKVASRPATHLPDPGHKNERVTSPYAYTRSSMIVLVSAFHLWAMPLCSGGGRAVLRPCTGLAVFQGCQKIVTDKLM